MRRGTVLARCLLAVAVARVAWAAFPDDPPDDPRYAPRTCPPATNCAPVSGQWNLLSYAPDVPPTPHPSGISADRAWQLTTGRPDTVIAVLDSGVNYDHEDLRNKVWLNRGEPPVPIGPCCMAPVTDTHDCNADGVFNVLDYACDARIADTNQSGALDRGDLRPFADGVDTDGNGYVDDLSTTSGTPAPTAPIRAARRASTT